MPFSTSGYLLQPFGVPIPLNLDRRSGTVDLAKIDGSKLDFGCFDVFF